MVQQNEKQDDSNEVPSSNNTGIEMEQDFQADAMSLSEDSGEDDDIDGENEELESEMGPTGPDSEAVGEKVCDENEDETLNDTREKYESGPSVKDRDGVIDILIGSVRHIGWRIVERQAIWREGVLVLNFHIMGVAHTSQISAYHS